MISIEDFDSSLLKIDKKLFKNIGIYCIGYITIKDFKYVNIQIVSPLHLIIGETDVSIEEKNGIKS